MTTITIHLDEVKDDDVAKVYLFLQSFSQQRAKTLISLTIVSESETAFVSASEVIKSISSIRSHLQRLTLIYSSWLPDASPEDLVEPLSKNCSLSLLSIQIDGPDDKKAIKRDSGGFQGFLDMNAAGRRYFLDETEGTDKKKGVTVLAAAGGNHDCLFCHLQENPSLCNHMAA